MKLKSKTMNKLLNPISWSAYLETIAVLAIAYYAFIGWKFYRPEINRIIDRLAGRNRNSRELPAALQYQGEENLTSAPVSNEPVHQEPHEPAVHTTIGETYELAQQLTACIAEATDKPFAPAALIPKLKKILNDYPDIAAIADREEINALIVRECEKTGTALLSESEVDMWWSA